MKKNILIIFVIGGYVSFFYDNAMNLMHLINESFPARYGGRLSSVIDMRMKNGNAKESHKIKACKNNKPNHQSFVRLFFIKKIFNI